MTLRNCTWACGGKTTNRSGICTPCWVAKQGKMVSVKPKGRPRGKSYVSAKISVKSNALTPYPWCIGAPTKDDCIKAGFCRRDPNCGE